MLFSAMTTTEDKKKYIFIFVFCLNKFHSSETIHVNIRYRYLLYQRIEILFRNDYYFLMSCLGVEQNVFFLISAYRNAAVLQQIAVSKRRNSDALYVQNERFQRRPRRTEATIKYYAYADRLYARRRGQIRKRKRRG